MAKQRETGMATYVGHLRQLIAVVEVFGERYAPANTRLTVSALTQLADAAKEGIAQVSRMIPPCVEAEWNRHEAFARLSPLATRIGATAKAGDIKPAALAQIEELVHKIHGRSRHRVKPDEGGNHFSATHRSFTEQIERLTQLIELVEAQPGYQPSVADLTPPALRLYAGELSRLNRMAFTAESALTAARRERDEILYAPVTGMTDTALAVKAYVKGVFGAQSHEFREVNHISFLNRKQ
jgi:hypothetical protein